MSSRKLLKLNGTPESLPTARELSVQVGLILGIFGKIEATAAVNSP